MNLQDVFPLSSEKEWKEKIEKDLKGESIDALIWESELGHINPVLFDYKNKYERVDAHIDQEDNTWLISESIDCKVASKANAKILDALAGGINCLHLLNARYDELSVVLAGVMLDIITTKIYVEVEEVHQFTTAINEILEQEGYTPENTEITTLVDPIGCYMGGHISDTTDVSSTAVVRSSIFESAGASIQHQLGYTIAMAHEYLLQLIASGMKGQEAAENIYFEISIGTSYFSEIGKLRALRTLWNTVLDSYNIDFKSVNIHAVTSSFVQSNLDVYNNLLRGTTAAMSASIGGVTSLEVLRYDTNLAEQQKDAARLSKNVSILLQEEAYLKQVKNAANGSYYVEQLTDIIIEKSWEAFQEVEKQGGILKAFEKEILQKNIFEDLSKKIVLFKKEELVLVGTNKHPNKKEKNKENYAEVKYSKYIQPYRLAQINMS